MVRPQRVAGRLDRGRGDGAGIRPGRPEDRDDGGPSPVARQRDGGTLRARAEGAVGRGRGGRRIGRG
ncbi:hypothetical protein, partial [Micromonospora sp. Rc5]|uniref:hypothetical protein n=1 Tax=Micromonospora sp. Rc5 TaxID=1920666 RepID=UPI001E336DF2